jgi:hypothetical protein
VQVLRRASGFLRATLGFRRKPCCESDESPGRPRPKHSDSGLGGWNGNLTEWPVGGLGFGGGFEGGKERHGWRRSFRPERFDALLAAPQRRERHHPASNLCKLKIRQARTVPLHEHLVAQGFLEFAISKGKGPLCYYAEQGASARDITNPKPSRLSKRAAVLEPGCAR